MLHLEELKVFKVLIFLNLQKSLRIMQQRALNSIAENHSNDRTRAIVQRCRPSDFLALESKV